MSRHSPTDAPRIRNWPIPFAGVAILAVFCALSIYEPRFVKAIALQTYDMLLAANAVPPASGKVVLVDIDDESIRKIGQWPWSRHLVARLADRLWDAQAAALVFDVGFSEPDRLSPANAFAFWDKSLPGQNLAPVHRESLPDFDEMFAQALARGPSVLGFYVNPSDVPLAQVPDDSQIPWRGTYFEKGHGRSFLPQGAAIPNPPIAPLREQARLGCFNATPDQDNIVRRGPLVFAVGPERIFPSLAMEAFRLHEGDPPLGIQYDSEGVAGVASLQVGPRTIPTDANARLIINFRSSRFPAVSAAQILENGLDPEFARGKIVIVGSSAVGLFDIYSTPVHREIPGAEIQATIIDNLLAGDMLVEPRWLYFADLATLVFGGLLLIVAVSRTRALLSTLLLALATSIPVGLSVYLLRAHHWIYLPSNIVLGWACTVLGAILVKYWQKEILADFDARLRAVNRQLSQEIEVRAAAEREAQDARAAALRATAAKSEFLANMSHEIRTPMNAVIGMCDLALRAATLEKQRDCLGKIGHSARSLLRIINDILDFSKLEAGKLAIDSVEFDLQGEIDELADLLGPQAHRKNLELVFDCAGDVPRALIGDPLRVRQVLINLVANAIKFTEKGSVVLRVEQAAVEQDASSSEYRLDFSVRDTGIGLSVEQRERLFQAFQQADTSTTRKYGGTGLGLAISQTLVHLMGGNIEITSEEGIGSTFRFSLAFRRQPPEKEATFVQPGDWPGKTVLLVGDASVTRTAVERMCRTLKLNPQPATAPLAAECLVAADLVILDVARTEIGDDWSTVLDGSIPLVLLLDPQSSNPIWNGKDSPSIQRLETPLTFSKLHHALLAAWGYKPHPLATPGLPSTEMPIHAPVLRNARVLLVDDNSINREIAMENMTEFGMIVETAQNGLEAVEKARTAEWGLILMDVQMPVMDGCEATRRIRELEKAGTTKRPRTPIVAMTAHARKEDEDRCKECGMDGYIEKPLDRNVFLETLVYHLSPLSAVEGLPPPPPSPSIAACSDTVLDEAAALERLRGNRPLHRRLLDQFLAEHRDDAQRMDEAIRSGDLARARDLAHSVKGSAANLGALHIHRIAREIDLCLRQERWSQAAELLASFEVAFSALRQHLAESPSPSPPNGTSSSGTPPATIVEACGRIIPLLRNGNTEGLDQLENLLPHLRQAGLGEQEILRLRQTADSFDLGQTANLIEQWAFSRPAQNETPKP